MHKHSQIMISNNNESAIPSWRSRLHKNVEKIRLDAFRVNFLNRETVMKKKKELHNVTLFGISEYTVFCVW